MTKPDVAKIVIDAIKDKEKFRNTGYYNMMTDQIEDDYDIERIRMTEDMFDKISLNSENPIQHVESGRCDCMSCNQWTIADFTENVDYIKED